MSNPFLERRRQQLEEAGRKDLAEDLERRAAEVPPAPPVIEAPELVEEEDAVPGSVDASFADILGPSESDARSAVNVVAFVKHFLDSFDFRASSTTIATAEREVSAMTSRERLEALRAATERGIKTKPVYYSKLAEWVHADLVSFYKEMLGKVGDLERVFGRYFGERRVVASPGDMLRVRAMSHSELNRMLDEVTDDDVRNRGSFYQALLDRLMREI